jgi:predicted dehydrogenase
MPHGNLKQGARASSQRKLPVGVVGVGYLGRFHAQKYAVLPDVKLIGVVDRISSRAQEIAGQLGVQAFSDYRELLPLVQAVSIVVPTDQHHRVAKDFLEAGKDVLLEKPMTLTVQEAEDLNRTAEEKGCRLQVGQLERFNPAFLAAQNKIKTPLFFEAHRLTSFRGRGAEVDVVSDLMIHDLDLILTLVRSSVDHIHAVGIPVVTGKVDIANARLQFVGGCVANITASRISMADQRRLRVFQPDSYLTMDFTAKKVNLYQRILPPGEDKPKIVEGQVEVKPGDALENEIRAFVHSSQSRTPPVVTGVDGQKALALALAIHDQIQVNFQKIPAIASFYAAQNRLSDYAR